jgi:hypothetical protein
MGENVLRFTILMRVPSMNPIQPWNLIICVPRIVRSLKVGQIGCHGARAILMQDVMKIALSISTNHDLLEGST